MASPQQELFTAVRKICCDQLGDSNVYEVLPPDGTAYPFIYVGEQSSVDDLRNKSVVFAEVRQTIHVYHNDPRRRGDVSFLLDELLQKLRQLEVTRTFRWRMTNASMEVRIDRQGDTFLHGILDIRMKMK